MRSRWLTLITEYYCGVSVRAAASCAQYFDEALVFLSGDCCLFFPNQLNANEFRRFSLLGKDNQILEKVNRLKSAHVFHCLDEGDVSGLAYVLTVKEAPRNTMLLKQGASQECPVRLQMLSSCVREGELTSLYKDFVHAGLR
eukprot:gene28496-35336_t